MIETKDLAINIDDKADLEVLKKAEEYLRTFYHVENNETLYDKDGFITMIDDLMTYIEGLEENITDLENEISELEESYY